MILLYYLFTNFSQLCFPLIDGRIRILNFIIVIISWILQTVIFQSLSDFTLLLISWIRWIAYDVKCEYSVLFKIIFISYIMLSAEQVIWALCNHLGYIYNVIEKHNDLVLLSSYL